MMGKKEAVKFQLKYIYWVFLLSNIQFFCRYNLQVLYWRNLDQEGDVSWWMGVLVRPQRWGGVETRALCSGAEGSGCCP